jgi:tRNA(fMet)-specific endonuclease VapC
MICLDTNVVIAAIGRRPSSVRDRLELALADGETVALSVIVLFELWFGIARSARPAQNAATLTAFLSLDLAPLPFDPQDAQEAGEIRHFLERAGTPIGAYDILIAAQARRRGAVLVTANAGEFTRVPGLKTESWAKR